MPGRPGLYRNQPSGMDGMLLPGSVFTVDRSGLRVGEYSPADAQSVHVTPVRAAPPTASGGQRSGFTAIVPRRVLDTREKRTPVGPGGTVDVRVTGQPDDRDMRGTGQQGRRFLVTAASNEG